MGGSSRARSYINGPRAHQLATVLVQMAIPCYGQTPCVLNVEVWEGDAFFCARGLTLYCLLLVTSASGLRRSGTRAPTMLPSVLEDGGQGPCQTNTSIITGFGGHPLPLVPVRVFPRSNDLKPLGFTGQDATTVAVAALPRSHHVRGNWPSPPWNTASSTLSTASSLSSSSSASFSPKNRQEHPPQLLQDASLSNVLHLQALPRICASRFQASFASTAHNSAFQVHIRELIRQSATHVMNQGGVVRKIESWGTRTLPQRMKRQGPYVNVGECVSQSLYLLVSPAHLLLCDFLVTGHYTLTPVPEPSARSTESCVATPEFFAGRSSNLLTRSKTSPRKANG